ncbi:MAG TPA: hypothetical protein V6D17_09175 [Candidatus Obscuribacterales bacterium]
MPDLTLTKQLDGHRVVTESIYAQITQMRVGEPKSILRLMQARKQRTAFAADGRLNIIAADHPARRVTGAGNSPTAFLCRRDLLNRLVSILAAGAADGVMATMDILEELVILDELLAVNGGKGKEQHEPGAGGLPSPGRFTEEKLFIASLNRGGLKGTSWELDDPVTGPGAEALRQMNIDGGKLLLRICDADDRTLRTIESCRQAISGMSACDLPIFIEPLPVMRDNGKLKVVREPAAIAAAACVASALGDSSRYLWLKLPICEQFELAAQATTLPILLLGGEASHDRDRFLSDLKYGLESGSNVRGTMIGRNVLFSDSPLATAKAVHSLVHGGPN